MTYDIYSYALEILRARENHYAEAAKSANSYVVKQSAVSEAAAYNSAYWILKYATEENWEALEQFDYFAKENT